jgi:predicted ArsR family transcriptional regulator
MLPSSSKISELNTGLDRDVFLRSLVRELAGALEDVVGLEEASGYISLVGRAIGEQINHTYRRELRLDQLSRSQVAEVLVDLKRRIEGDFYIIEENDERIVLGNRLCPFAEKVIGRPSMCMMTSNVFGHIAAENLGYGKVELRKTIADGHAECRVVVYIEPSPEADAAEGREYFRSA